MLHLVNAQRTDRVAFFILCSATNLHQFVRLHFQYSSFTRWFIHLVVGRVIRFFFFCFISSLVNRIQCACTNTISDKADTPFVVWCLSLSLHRLACKHFTLRITVSCWSAIFFFYFHLKKFRRDFSYVFE